MVEKQLFTRNLSRWTRATCDSQHRRNWRN